MEVVRPTLNEVKKLLNEKAYGVIPISTEIFSDSTTPIEALKKLKKVCQHVYLLESAEADKQWGRYSFLGCNPTWQITCRSGIVTINKTSIVNNTAIKNNTAMKQSFTDNPRKYIRQIVEENVSPIFDYLPSFTGGLVGYFSYDYIKYSEPTLTLDASDEEGFQDVDLMMFDKVIAFDHYRKKIILIANMKTKEIESDYQNAVKELEKLKNLIQQSEPLESEPIKLLSEFTPLFEEKEYCKMVDIAKKYIKEGDVFQVVLSNRFEARMEGSLIDVYRVLRTMNPSPYMFYFSGTEGEIAGASPETLVKLENNKLFTYPLAGTRRRGNSLEEDERLEIELLADKKELAEHNMLVDLGRNDIGKISKIGSVSVEKYMKVERFSHVMHIGSTVCGEIREDMDALNAMDAILPAGTLSGAPKLRACEIINELENNKRGIYGGAIGYISFTGNMDTCIAIRLAFCKNGKVFIRSGAGIVADSVAENEYRECIQKATAVKKAIENASKLTYRK